MEMGNRGTFYVGIDPGGSGAIAVLVDGQIRETILLESSPLSTLTRIRGLVGRLKAQDVHYRFCVEKVGGYVKGSKGNIGSRMFEFGKSYGSIVTSLYACNVLGFLNPMSQVWQRKIGAPTRGDKSKEEHKKDLFKIAERIFPDQSPTLKTADAMLLAYYATLV